MRTQIERNIKYSLAMNHLIQKLGINVTPEEVETEMKKFASMNGKTDDRLLEDHELKERITAYLIEAKLFDKIIALNSKK